MVNSLNNILKVAKQGLLQANDKIRADLEDHIVYARSRIHIDEGAKANAKIQAITFNVRSKVVEVDRERERRQEAEAQFEEEVRQHATKERISEEEARERFKAEAAARALKAEKQGIANERKIQIAVDLAEARVRDRAKAQARDRIKSRKLSKEQAKHILREQAAALASEKTLIELVQKHRRESYDTYLGLIGEGKAIEEAQKLIQAQEETLNQQIIDATGQS